MRSQRSSSSSSLPRAQAASSISGHARGCGDGEDGPQVAGKPELVHGTGSALQRGPMAASSRVGSMPKVSALDVDEHRAGAHRQHGVGGGDEAVADGDHLVADAHVQRAQGQLEGGGAARHGHGVRGAQGGPQLVLEGGHLGALQDPARAHDAGDGVGLGAAELGTGDGDTNARRGGAAKLCGVLRFQLWPSRPATRVASSTARASTERMRPSSRVSRPAMVQPAGVVT